MAIAADGAGGVYLAWVDSRNGNVTYLDRLSAEGTDATGWAQDGEEIFGLSSDPVLLADGSGGVYITADYPSIWHGVILLARVTADGAPSPGWPSSGITIPGEGYAVAASRWPLAPPDQLLGARDVARCPVLALAPDGGPLVAFTHVPRTNLNWHAHVTRFTTSGQTIPAWGPTGMILATTASEPTVACSDGGGGSFVAFSTWQGTYPIRAAVQRINADASQRYGAMVCSVASNQDSPGLVPDGAGGAFVFWQDDRDGAISHPFVLHVLPDLSYAPGWPAEGVALSAFDTRAGTVRYSWGYLAGAASSVASDAAGGAYIAWTDYRDDAAGDVYAQHVLGDGSFAAGWPANGLAICAVPGGQKHPSVSEDGAGGLFVCWEDARSESSDIYAQHVDASGNVAPGWPTRGFAVCVAESAQSEPRVVGDGAGSAIVAWIDRRHGPPQIYAARVSQDGVVPTLPELLSAEGRFDRISLVWFAGGWSGAAIEVERSAAGSGWLPIASLWPDGDGRIVYEDRDVVPGASYRYRLAFDAQATGEVSVSVPPRPQMILETPQPNPSAGELSVRFSLPDDHPARIDVLDIAGRQILAREVESDGPGDHAVSIGGVSRLAPGFYIVRLSRDGRAISRHAVVVR